MWQGCPMITFLALSTQWIMEWQGQQWVLKEHTSNQPKEFDNQTVTQ